MSDSQAFYYDFAAIRGTQAGRPYYVAMCPLSVIPKIFSFEETDIAPDFRSQRVLDQRRVPEIAAYIVENPKTYAFSSITASIDGPTVFEPVSDDRPDIGRLRVDMTSTFHVNDGQHRRSAIQLALEQQPELGRETISVVFYPDLNLVRRQQLFSDLNKNAVRPTTSMTVLYDHRDVLANLTRGLVGAVPVFRNLTELERNSISHTSRKLFTLSSIHKATASLLGKKPRTEVTEGDAEVARMFWSAVAANMPDWEAVRRGRQHAGELRRDQVQTSGLMLHALARMGRTLLAESDPNRWKERLAPLQDVDWSRRNPVWEGRALHAGVLKKSRANIILTSNFLKALIGLPLTPDEQQQEDDFAAVA